MCVLCSRYLVMLQRDQCAVNLRRDVFFHPQMENGVVAYDDPQTGRTLHLIINKAIHIPHLDHHLLYPMQCHMNDVTINNLVKISGG